jgi:hypothetical protein
LVSEYLAVWADRSDAELDVYRKAPRFSESVRLAALAQMGNGKRHPHQYRIPRSSLERSRDVLLKLRRLANCRSFDALHEEVRDAVSGILKIGELTVYDTAHRIGAKLGLAPERIYLHAGTRQGLRALGIQHRDGSILLAELPEPLQLLIADQAEDFLCIFKARLRAYSSKDGAWT